MAPTDPRLKERVFFTLLCLLVFRVSAVELTAAPEKAKLEVLNWMQCVREAAANNPGIQSAWKSLQNQEALRKGAYSTLFPQLSATASGTRSYNPEILTSGSTIVSGGDSSAGSSVATSFGGESSQTNYSSSYSAGITLQQQLFDGWRTQGNIRQTRAQAQVALAQLLTEKASVSFELKSAFAQLLYAQELIGISKNIVEQRTLNYRLVDLKYEIGRENKGSLLLSKANLSQSELDLKQAYRTLTVSQRQLLAAMGRPRMVEVRAEGKLATYRLPSQPDFDRLARETPAYFQQAATVEASRAGITVARSDFYPQIDLSGSYSSNGSELATPDSWSVGLNGSWSIFDGGKTYFNVRAARATLESDQAKLRQTDADTARTLAEDYQSYVNAVENVRVSGEFFQASSLRAKIAEAQYRNGLISFQDFDTITNDAITRQKTELQSRRDAVLAEAQWEQSQGKGAIP